MRVLWVPIFSMRSYETGKYAILKDGNFQLTLARALASDFERITLCIPSEVSDLVEFQDRLKQLDAQHIELLQCRYGANAVETREMFWRENPALTTGLSGYDVVISDITSYPGELPVIYNFNITKLPELDRPYIDKFFDQDLASMKQSLFTTVLNPRQRDYILEIWPELLDKVIVHTKCAHEALLPQIAGFGHPGDPQLIFWPFRISDKAYRWSEFLVWFEATGLAADGYHVLITDPNDTAKDLPSFVTRQKLSKDEYYEMLCEQPIVVMLDDIDTVLHPGTVEFLHYGCPVIAFDAKLIDNPNSIVDLNELGYAVRNVVYDTFDQARWRSHRFVYGSSEVDQFYNEEFIRVRQA